MPNLILNTDSYKASHWLQYPPGTEQVSCYIESRGGRFNRTVFFGLQMLLMQYLSNRVVTWKDVDSAEEFLSAHGLPFYREGWEYVISQYNGKLPVYIEAVPEGSVIPTNNVLVQITNTDPKCFWLPSYLETLLLRGVWYTTTVCTKSWMCKKAILESLQRTSDDPGVGLDFKLHDFGARGASSFETASLGGCAHLVNFQGTDTMSGILAAQKYYGAAMCGFSIPAAEHSTITSWGGPGAAGELDAYGNMLNQFAKPGKLVAVVSDSYDLFSAIRTLWGGPLKKQIIASGATLVVRPDSGNPVTIVSETIQALMDVFGHQVNQKGFDVLPPYIRVIQGDGVDYDPIKDILNEMENRKLSADNIAFGMGGALLQNLNRDFLKFAMKTSAAKVNGCWRDVYKDPITDHGKKSKRGQLALVQVKNEYYTIPKEDAFRFPSDNLLKPVFENGKVLMTYKWEEVKDRALRALYS